MNSHPDEPGSDDRETPAQVVSDDYERYLEDEYGYAYGARDMLPLRVLERHDYLADQPREALEEMNVEELDDFEMLGLARGLADDGEFEAFADVLERLLESDAGHDAIRYPEIALFGALIALRHGEAERADEWLRRSADRWTDRARPAHLLRAQIAVREGDRERAHDLYRSLAEDHPDDPEVAYEIAEDLADEGRKEWAAEWVERCRERAERAGDRAVLVDLDILEADLENG